MAGEAKRKAEAPPPERPFEAIFRMKMTVEASKGQPLDRDTADFMKKLGAVLAWLDHLEKQTGEMSPPPKLDA